MYKSWKERQFSFAAYTIDCIENPEKSTDKYFELIRDLSKWLNM